MKWVPNPGNALAFYISGNGKRTADSADNPTGIAPLLSVDYQVGTSPGTYAHWAGNQASLVNAMGDPDQDGSPNLLEYALGKSPTVADPAPLPFVLVPNAIRLNYSLSSLAADIRCEVEWSDMLSSNWSTAGVTYSILSDNGTTRQMLAAIPSGTGKRFVRLRVQR
jgi:hypothetical protein